MAGAGFQSTAAHDEAWKWLASQAEFDVAMLQESNPPVWARDQFPHLIHNPKYPLKGKKWGNSILARVDSHSEFNPVAEQPWLEQIIGSITVAKPVDETGVWLVNIHSNANPLSLDQCQQLKELGAPHCRPTRMWEVEAATYFLEPILKGKRFIFGGDLNSGHLFDTVNDYNFNKIMFENMRLQGFNDLRLPHSPNEQQTYFKQGKAAFQLDHLFGDNETLKRTSRWEVLTHVVRDLKLSDHAPVVVEVSSITPNK